MIRISCKNERFTYDMYHIVKSFLPDAEISQKVDPEQELLIEMTAEEEPDLEEQACDKKVRWTFFHCREAEIADISEKREQKRYINKKLYLQYLCISPIISHRVPNTGNCGSISDRKGTVPSAARPACRRVW